MRKSRQRRSCYGTLACARRNNRRHRIVLHRTINPGCVSEHWRRLDCVMRVRQRIIMRCVSVMATLPTDIGALVPHARMQWTRCASQSYMVSLLGPSGTGAGYSSLVWLQHGGYVCLAWCTQIVVHLSVIAQVVTIVRASMVSKGRRQAAAEARSRKCGEEAVTVLAPHHFVALTGVTADYAIVQSALGYAPQLTSDVVDAGELGGL